MKVSNKGFDYCFNAQAMVDGAHQIIVAAETCDAANDKEQAVPMADATLANLEAAGIEWPQGVAAKDKEPAVPMADATRSSGEATPIEQPQDQGQPVDGGDRGAWPGIAHGPQRRLQPKHGGLECGASHPHLATGRQRA